MSTAPRWKVVAIVEDISDGYVLSGLLQKAWPQVEIDALPAGGNGEIKARGDALIRIARERLKGRRGCVAVVIDADGKDFGHASPYREIAELCQRLEVVLLPCEAAMEAWLLADPGCCEWLGLPHKASHSIDNPKKVVGAAYYKATGRSYQRESRRRIALQASGPDPSKNRSLAAALKRLSDCLNSPVPRGTVRRR